MGPNTKKGNTTFNIIFGAVVYLFVAFFASHVNVVWFDMLANAGETALGEGPTILEALPLAMEHMETAPFDIFPLNFKVILYSLGICLFIAAWLLIDSQNKKQLRPGIESGSASWNKDLKKYNKTYSFPIGKTTANESDFGWVDENGKDVDLVEYREHYEENLAKKKAEAEKQGKKYIYQADVKPKNENVIMGDNIFLSMDGKKTQRNLNTLICGGSGSGKSRFVVKPNVLQENCSYVITDPGGMLCQEIGGYFLSKGYDMKVFNLTQMQNSNSYNPFAYIRNEEGVMTMINTLIKNTTPKGASQGDPFWEKSETALLMALCFYLYYECLPEERNFATVLKLLRHAEVKEDQEDYESDLDIIFNILREENPEHIAVRNYDIFKQAAGKTAKSILISCSVRLQVFNMQAIENLTNIDNIDLMSIGDRPTVLFCIVPIVDTTFNFLVALMYTQLFDSLYYHAGEECKGHRLPIHVRFMLDEFANIGVIPEFEQKVATMRNFNISTTIILQNMAQLKTMYKDSWESITGNCDTFVFLGGQEQTTLEYVSKKLGKETIKTKNNSRTFGSRGSSSQSFNTTGRDLMTPDEIGRMDNTCCIVFLRGELPFYCKKYNYPRHKNYKYTGDADDKNIYVLSDHIKTENAREVLNERNEEDLEDMKREYIEVLRETDASELDRVTAPIREETFKGLQTLEIKDVNEETLTDIGIRSVEDVDDILNTEECYDPNSEYDIGDEEVLGDDFLSDISFV